MSAGDAVKKKDDSVSQDTLEAYREGTTYRLPRGHSWSHSWPVPRPMAGGAGAAAANRRHV